jgi:hypothetical protein
MTPGEKDFLRTITEGFKTLSAQLISYQEAVEIIRETNPQCAQIVAAAQIDVLNSPALKEIVRQKFDAALEIFLQRAPESLSDSRVLALCQAWFQKRKLPIN